MNTQPEALRLADYLEAWKKYEPEFELGDMAAAELRRLHAELNGEKLGHRACFASMQKQAGLKADLLEALKDTHALLQATLLVINDAEARTIAKQQLGANRTAIAKATGGAA